MRLLTFATLIAAGVACTALTGCNTIAGVGEDITGTARWAQGVLPTGGY